MAVSNVFGIYPIMTSYNNGDMLTAGIIGYVCMVSFISHLLESHKHGMYGFGIDKNTSYVLNRLDVLGCLLVIGRLLYIFDWDKGIGIDHIAILIIAGITNFYSEYDALNAGRKYKYMLFYVMWHILIYKLMNMFLINYIFS